MAHRFWVPVTVVVWVAASLGCASDPSPRTPADGPDSGGPEVPLDAEDSGTPRDAEPSSDARSQPDAVALVPDASTSDADADAGTRADASAAVPDAAVAGDAGSDAAAPQADGGPVDASTDAGPPQTCTADVRIAEAGEESDPLSQLDAFVCDAWTLCCEESCHGTGALEGCLSARESQNARVREQLASGRLRLDAAKVRGCLADLRAASISCVPALQAVERAESPTGCPGAFVGSVPTNEACLADLECAPVGSARSICVQGFCFPAAPGQAGDPCYVTLGLHGAWWTNDEGATGPAACRFDDGLHCHPTQGVCAPTLAEGASCDLELQCGGAPCLGTCLAPKAAGVACDPSLDTCEQGTCTGGFCVPFSQNDCEGTP